MDLSQLHFAQPLWLWTLLAVPLIWVLFFLYNKDQHPIHQLESFIDKHLLPHLLLNNHDKKKKLITHLAVWSFAWSCLAFGLAGPRWDFRDIVTFRRDQSLAVLLDLSESMNAQDVSPSRLRRAKQKIEDLLNLSKGVRVGLIAFAADPHMIVPLTEDKEAIRHLLSSLETDLVYVQGSKLAPALEMAATLFNNDPGTNNAIVVISDGGFEDGSAIHTAQKIAEKGIVIHTLGIGTLEGAALKDSYGAIVKKNGSPVISKLERERFREISKIGRGRYFDADHSEQIALLFEDLEKRSELQQQMEKKQRFWEERFYLFLLPALPFFLLWYRRGFIFALALFILKPDCSQASILLTVGSSSFALAEGAPSHPSCPGSSLPIVTGAGSDANLPPSTLANSPTFNSQHSISRHFYNAEQRAGLAYENNDYSTAAIEFEDPYRKGVAYYKMGDYPAAEEMFRQSTRPEVASSAAYNLGNALVQQNKLYEAIAAFEAVLQKWPEHKLAKENLEVVKKMLEQQEQQQQPGEEGGQDKPEEQEKKQNQKQKNGSPQQQDSEKRPENESEEDPLPSKNESSMAQNQEDSDLEEPSENPSEDQESKQDKQETQQPDEQPVASEQKGQRPEPRSQEDLNADLWLNQIKSDPNLFLKNKFYLESKKNGTKEETDPW
ncbi:MAG: VWA domain-containing protein [Verrucomicrobia bacterium]|nr:VWA domain-containing protein [Verrucomicrobiota bacterium]